MNKIDNLRHSPEYNDLAAHIQSLREESEEVVFSPGSGNWGDGLINYGTRQFLSTFSIPWQELNKNRHLSAIAKEEYDGKLVLIGGGGAWGRNWNRNRGIVSEIAEQAKHVVVLPTTYDLPKVENPNVSYYARDRFSSLENVPEANFCHDMAFFTDLKVPEPEQKVWRLFAMREDREGFGYGTHFPLNLDVSLLGSGESRRMAPFFNIVNHYNITTTDRLHVAIVGAMLGVKVNLIAGNYPKNVDLFRSSLESNFPNVRLRDFKDVLDWYKF